MNHTQYTSTQIAIEAVRSYLESIGYAEENTVTVHNDVTAQKTTLSINVTPVSRNLAVVLGAICFWGLDNIDESLLTITSEAVTINLFNYEIADKVAAKLLEFKAKLVGFSVEHDCLWFELITRPGEFRLNYDELEALRDIVDPARKFKYSVKQTGDGPVAHIRIF